MADAIVFWVPRDIEGGMPAFTTNFDWGKWQASGKCVLGAPPNADKVRYLIEDAERLNIPYREDLLHTLGAAVGRLGGGSKRTGGEREVPLHIWRLPHFQGWYQALKQAGNRLDGAKLLWHFRPGNQSFVFAYALHVDVWIAAEDRHKVNEFILGRPDISCIVAFRRPSVSAAAPMMSMAEANLYPISLGYLLDTEIALVKEFRSPVRTPDSYVHEVPGGSSHKPSEDPFRVMCEEMKEETSLTIDDPSRFRLVGARQLASTFSVHQAHVYAIPLTKWEMAYLKREQADHAVHGNIEDSERTYIEVRRLGDMLDQPDVDWSMMGMIFTALLQG